MLLNAERSVPGNDGVPPSDPAAILTADKPLERSFPAGITGTLFVTRPYFFRTDTESARDILRNSNLRNAPATPPALVVLSTLKYRDISLTIERVVSSSEQPVSYVPSISVAVTPRVSILPDAVNTLSVSVLANPAGQPVRSETLTTRDGWTAIPTSRAPTVSGSATFRVQAPPGARRPTTIEAIVRIPDGSSTQKGSVRSDMPGFHIRTTTLLRLAASSLSTSPPPPTSTSPTSPAPATTSPPPSTNLASIPTSSPPQTSPPNPSSLTTPSSSASAPTSTPKLAATNAALNAICRRRRRGDRPVQHRPPARGHWPIPTRSRR